MLEYLEISNDLKSRPPQLMLALSGRQSKAKWNFCCNQGNKSTRVKKIRRRRRTGSAGGSKWSEMIGSMTDDEMIEELARIISGP